jgi:hypothetical protein
MLRPRPTHYRTIDRSTPHHRSFDPTPSIVRPQTIDGFVDPIDPSPDIWTFLPSHRHHPSPSSYLADSFLVRREIMPVGLPAVCQSSARRGRGRGRGTQQRSRPGAEACVFAGGRGRDVRDAPLTGVSVPCIALYCIRVWVAHLSHGCAAAFGRPGACKSACVEVGSHVRRVFDARSRDGMELCMAVIRVIRVMSVM